ncbi:hypothetical protein [Acetobacterium wieringae]|uniref:Uncharacterized protein n=1 Tax=Acetobacterium wieringae TaxID=52694 RepID=A0A1F2PM30_9FIRM|nr:hypothetical protein [Acetobacterium wieringae]OFV71791.1 hypothetical protein ACWI_07640 [Acetobacterium wieringae]
MFDSELEIHEKIYRSSIIIKFILFLLLPVTFLLTVSTTVSTIGYSMFSFYFLLWLLGPYLVIWGIVKTIQKSIKEYCDPILVGKFERNDKAVNIGFITAYVAGYLISLFFVLV